MKQLTHFKLTTEFADDKIHREAVIGFINELNAAVNRATMNYSVQIDESTDERDGLQLITISLKEGKKRGTNRKTSSNHK